MDARNATLASGVASCVLSSLCCVHGGVGGAFITMLCSWSRRVGHTCSGLCKVNIHSACIVPYSRAQAPRIKSMYGIVFFQQRSVLLGDLPWRTVQWPFAGVVGVTQSSSSSCSFVVVRRSALHLYMSRCALLIEWTSVLLVCLVSLTGQGGSEPHAHLPRHHGGALMLPVVVLGQPRALVSKRPHHHGGHALGDVCTQLVAGVR